MNEDLIKRELENGKETYSRIRGANDVEMENELMKWFGVARAKRIPLSQFVIQRKAIAIHSILETKRKEKDASYEVVPIKASDGWFYLFQKRHGIKLKHMEGERALVNEDVVERWKESLPLRNEELKRDGFSIYNMDETALYYKLLPSKSYLLNTEDNGGTKNDKKRITIALLVSEKGEITETMVIEKTSSKKTTSCFNTKIGCKNIIFAKNQNAWMTSKSFMAWMKKLNEKMKNQGKKMALFLDNCSSHLECELRNLKVIMFPKNTTSRTQPLDAGIIQNIKMNYRKEFVNYLIGKMECKPNVDLLLKSIKPTTCFQILSNSLRSIKKDPICYKNQKT